LKCKISTERSIKSQLQLYVAHNNSSSIQKNTGIAPARRTQSCRCRNLRVKNNTIYTI